MVPAAAILRGTQGSYVYVVKDSQAEVRPVAVDVTQGNITIISSGLQEGEQVVVDGQDKLQAGTKVVVQPASATGAAAPVSGNGGGSMPGGGTRQRAPRNAGNQ